MHYVDGMPYDALSELLDVSVSALKMRALRAREALNAVLAEGDVTGTGSSSSLLSGAVSRPELRGKR
ncbi:Sigma-70, region 4 [compost metagenome]